MIRVIGFAMFFIAVGMIVMMFIPSRVCGIVVSILLILVGYNLFCCKKCK